MKHYIPFFLLTFIVCWKPTPVGKSQDTVLIKKLAQIDPDILIDSTRELQKKSDSLKIVKNKLFKEELKYQELLANKKPKVVVKEILVPIYINSDTTLKKEETMEAASASDYLPAPNGMEPEVKKAVKKRKFLYRLFHHKKRKK